jgi:integrase
LLTRNPADAVDPPRTARGPMNTYDLDQTAELIEAMRPTRMLVPTLLAVRCGMRRGEIAALRWKNVNLSSGQLAVAQTSAARRPRTARVAHWPCRPAVWRNCTHNAHRLRQAEELLKVHVRLSDDTFVVAQADGTPLELDTVTQDWFRKRWNFPAAHPVP